MKESSTEVLLIVDDDETMRSLLTRILSQAGYCSILVAPSAPVARKLLQTNHVDLVLTDMQMPGGSGMDLLKHLHGSTPSVATLMITVLDNAELADQALALGAYGYIIKPFRPSEVVIGVGNALRRRALERENQAQRDHLEQLVRDRTAALSATVAELKLSEKNLRTSRSETIERLASAGEYHDAETGSHVARMSRYCEIIARECGAGDLSRVIREASALHDVGKIGIPDHILMKPGPLTPKERSVMQGHAAIGHDILADSGSPLLSLAAEIALTHHEHLNGAGYPNGLSGETIPLAGRIAAIADVFDALTSNRVYGQAFALADAVEIMDGEAGTHFDPELLSLFWNVLPEALAIEQQFVSLEPPATTKDPRLKRTRVVPITIATSA